MLAEKSIIVTGSGSGIGRAAAIMFAANGAKVLVAERSEATGRAVVDEITQAGGTAIFQQTDVSKEPEVERMVAIAVERFGRLDGAFNNAGIPMHFKLLPDLTSQEYDKVTGVHERGVFLCLKYEIAAMRQSGGGAIVNTSSTGGQTALPFMAEYVAAKHGILGLTRAAASEARNTDVRVNAVLPGLIATPALASAGEDYANSPEMKIIVERHSIGRIGQPEDVARAVKWLLSDESAFVNGVALPVDGGYLAR